MTELYRPGRWPLAEVLAEIAGPREAWIGTAEPDARPCLRYGAHGDAAALPEGSALSDAILAAALGSVGQCFAPTPDAVTGTVLQPAGGVCGPARHGPVDAVRTGYTTHLDQFPLGFRVTCRILGIQHTRCWVASLTFTGTAPLTFTPDEDVVVLPAVVAHDTARTSQYMLDRGDGFHWRPVALAGPPVAETDGGVCALALFTEAHYVRALLDTVPRETGRRTAGGDTPA